MQKITFITLILLAFNANAQKGTHNISVGISNNGQLSETMTRYYFSWWYSADRNNYEKLDIKTDLAYSYTTARQIEFGLIAGFSPRTERYDHNAEHGKMTQQYLSAMPFFLKGWSLGDIELAAGGGIPYYLISDYRARIHSDFGSNTTMDITGGMAVGANALVRMKWSFSDRLYLSGLASFGVLYAEYGNTSIQKSYSPEGVLVGTAYSFYEQKRTIIPSPELSISIGFRI